MRRVLRWFKLVVLRWLELDDHAALLRGLRQDSELLAARFQSQNKALGSAIFQVNETTKAAFNAVDRLNAYERHVPALSKVKRLIDARAVKEAMDQKRAARVGDEAPDVNKEPQEIPPSLPDLEASA